MTARMRELIKWFPSGTSEGEQQIMQRAFVYVDEFDRIIDPPVGNPYLLVGRKGTGKSAVVDFASAVLTEKRVPSIILKPENFDTSSVTESDSPGDLIRRFKGIILRAIIAKLAESTPNFATGDHAAIYHAAVQSGDVSPDVVGRILRIIPVLAKPVVDAELGTVFPLLTERTRTELQAAVGRVLEVSRFHVFLDDTDQVASPDVRGHLNRIWCLLLAMRGICSSIPQLKAVITLRTEVWERIQRDDAVSRDQTDHFIPLVVEMSSRDEEIDRIINRRLVLASESLELLGEPYPNFFEGNSARAPHSEDYRSWRDLIIKRSRGRPRDAIQLIAAMTRDAIRVERNKITEDEFRAVMPTFSARRAELFDQEVAQEFSPALEVIRSFATAEFSHGGFKMSAEAMLAHLTSMMGRFPVILFGRTLHQNNQNDIYDIWRFLYVANVINARVSDNTQTDGYRHLRPEDDPMLVTKNRWNELQAMLWEINPAFRDYLMQRQLEHTTSIGLPRARPRRRR